MQGPRSLWIRVSPTVSDWGVPVTEHEVMNPVFSLLHRDVHTVDHSSSSSHSDLKSLHVSCSTSSVNELDKKGIEHWSTDTWTN